MLQIIQSVDTVSLKGGDDINRIVVIDILFSGSLHAESMLPDSWTLLSSSNRIICINFGTSTPFEILSYTGNLTIKNASIYDAESNLHKPTIVFRGNDYWELTRETFDTSTSFYENFSSEITKKSNIKGVSIIKNNLMSKNDEFFYKDGSPYYGEYHMHQDGQAMTGASHERSSVNIYRKNEIGKVVDLKKYNIKSTLAKKVKNIKMQNQKSIELAKEKGVDGPALEGLKGLGTTGTSESGYGGGGTG